MKTLLRITLHLLALFTLGIFPQRSNAFELLRAGVSIGTPSIGGTLGSQFTRLAGFTGTLEASGPVAPLSLRGNFHFQPLTLTHGGTVGFTILDASLQGALGSPQSALWGVTPTFAFGPGVSYVYQSPPSGLQGNVRNAALYMSLNLTTGLRFPILSQLEGSLEVQGRWILSQLVSGNTMLTVWTPSAGLHWKL